MLAKMYFILRLKKGMIISIVNKKIVQKEQFVIF